jgi:pyruvate dehydrogenase E2 component (dihydrolipoamide acetyltransferase)
MYGTEEFAAIINPPQSAILAVGGAKKQPVVIDDQVTIATVVQFTLSVDHRPVDGAVAAEWMKTFVEIVENPMRILI